MANLALADAFIAAEAAEGQAGQVRLAVHDATRLEWSLSVPLPEREPLEYALRVEMRIAQNAFVRHVPWDRMQAFARLDGPALVEGGPAVGIDQLRRGALAMAGRISRISEGFARHCRLAASPLAAGSTAELEEGLSTWLSAGLRLASDARQRLVSPSHLDPARPEAAEVARERRLVDEYISVRLLELLAGAERTLSELAEARRSGELGSVVTAVQEELAEALAEELGYRASRGFMAADGASPAALERFLDRTSRLKKHFQEVLFLEPESFDVAERAYHWIAGFVAVVASTWAFAWQIWLTARGAGSGTDPVGSGLFTFAVVAGVVYATKDRIKEIGRNWMTRRVHRVWGAERVTRYRAPVRRLPGRDVVVSARELFDQRVTVVPDSLNPESGALQTATVLRYEHRGTVIPKAALLASGVRRVKHVFRYDLSPLFARLDDAKKPVPVLDGLRKRVRCIDAPRCYRVPIRVEVTCGGVKYHEDATLVLHKQGLDRLEREYESGPALADVGVEPG